MAKRLLHIPIIHTAEDMGSLRSAVEAQTKGVSGEAGWQAKVHAVHQYWRSIERILASIPLDYTRVRLYQDGLPLCGREVDIVVDLAKGGSTNHRLLLYLMGKGATLMGTESPELLLREYRLAQQALTGGGDQESLGQTILEQRDRFIARRVNRTLLDGEVGLLFLGWLHSPLPWLDPAIRVRSILTFQPKGEPEHGFESA